MGVFYMRDRIIPVNCIFSEDGKDLEYLLLQSFRLFLIRELGLFNIKNILP